MKLLIIGGTVFVGRALVDEAVERGHEVTLFNRGKSDPEAFPAIETLKGDREFDLHKLQGRNWDAVIDTCGYLPRLVRLSAEALKGQVDHYTFISTISVYPPGGDPRRDETADLLPLVDESVEEVTGETYGPFKVSCETAVRESFPDSALMIRAGLIAGPYDRSNRFTYWVTRAARGGDAIAPPAEQPIQFVDVRDLAAFTMERAEARANGVYNVIGPAQRLSFGELLSRARVALGSDTVFQFADDALLQARDVAEFVELPLWLNRESAESVMNFSFDKALADGLRLRPLEETVRDTRAWLQVRAPDFEKPTDLSREKELALLAAMES